MKNYSVDDLAEMFEVHPETIRRMLKDGRLKGYKIGKAWRVNAKDLEQYVESISNK